MFVARDSDGQLLKIPIPVHYLYVFVAGALIGMFTITGIAGSYTRMLAKTLRFNQLREEKDSLAKNYNHLEKVAKEKDVQVASLGSLASEVSALYGLKTEAEFKSAVPEEIKTQQIEKLEGQNKELSARVDEQQREIQELREQKASIGQQLATATASMGACCRSSRRYK